MDQGCLDSFFAQVRDIIANGGKPSLGVLAALVDSAESNYRRERAETLERERRKTSLEYDDLGALRTPSQLADRCRELARRLTRNIGPVATEHVEKLLTIAIARAAGAYAFGGAAFADAETTKAEVVAAIRALPRRVANPDAVERWRSQVRANVRHGREPGAMSSWGPDDPDAWTMSSAAMNEALRLMRGES